MRPILTDFTHYAMLGVYSSEKANVDAMLKKVKAAGFKDAFVKYS
jgi:hypothetical protein